jgi:tRNA threonylcarbamoyl adenosine modification protein (Sua5/YciO/YrdC/YwlC family)
MFQTDNTKIKFLKNNDVNIGKCVDIIVNNKLLIFPTENVYQIGCSCFSKDSIKKIYKIKKKNINQLLTINILNWDMGKNFVDFNDFEYNIIKKLIYTFWPGPLTLILKKSEFSNNLLNIENDYKNNFIALNCPQNDIIQKIIKNSITPIISTSANLNGGITSTTPEHIIKYFKNCNISVIKNDNHPKYCIESTMISIQGDTNNVKLSIERPGIITEKNIQECLADTNFNFKIETNFIPSFEFWNKKNNLSLNYKIKLNKKIILFNFIDSSIIDSKKFNENIKISIDKYLSVSALIDFNNLNYKHYKKFGAYVDLSENGDIKEALFNLYNVLHQLDDCKEFQNILIFDFYQNKTGLYATLYDRLCKFCSFSRTVIPLY